VPKQLVRNPLVWLAGLLATVLAIIFTYAYIGAFLNPAGMPVTCRRRGQRGHRTTFTRSS